MPRRLTIPLLGGLLALYLLVPIAVLLVRLAGGAGSSAGAPGLGAAVWTSVLTATISTAIIAVLGIPLAHLLAHRRGRGWALLGLAVQLPLALPPLMSGILLVEVVGPYTAIGRLFGGGLTDTTAAIVVAQTFVSAPFLIVAARSAFETVDEDLLDVAATLGHDRWSRFRRVSLPLAAPGIRAGLLLTWLRAFGEFGATVILAYHPYSLPVFTFVQFSSTGLATALPATATALGAAAAVLLLTHAAPSRLRRRPRLPPGTERSVRSRRPTEPRPTGPLRFELRTRLGNFELELSHRCATRRLAILGESGAGKSLTLRGLAGLRTGGQGIAASVAVGPTDLSALPACARRIGWVPQGGALMPHLEVWRQLTFPVGADSGVAAHWLERLELTALAGRLPGELSGGQRQRVALARALTAGAELLLLDEPLTSVDAPARRELRRELRRLQQATGIATVLVTHDADEAAALADEVIVLAGGRALQSGPAREVFERPRSARVARLLGVENFGDGHVIAPGRIRAAGEELEVEATGLAPGTPISWCVRAEHVRLLSAGAAGLQARVVDAVDHATGQELEVLTEGGLELTARSFGPERLAAGERRALAIAARDITVWAAEAAEHGTAPAWVAACE
jgi:ABC-type sulfate/molybdate transport systems ATPase subunit/ABC-type sulfate transport system permease component